MLYKKLKEHPLPFKESLELFENSKRICSADDGWASIIRVDDMYYWCQYGLPECEGHVYLIPVQIIDNNNSTEATDIEQ